MKTALAIIVLILVIAGAYLLFVQKTHAPVTNPAMQGGTSAPLETTNPNPPADTNAPAASASVSATVGAHVTVTYNGASFSPASVTVKKGDTVTFVDTSASPMWIASNPHPIHNGYSGTTVDQHCPDTAGTAFDECAVGASYSFTFQKVGTWGYHNHANHSATGTIVVTQ